MMKRLSILRPASRTFLHLKPTAATRSFSKTAAMAAASPKFSEGSDEPRLTKELDGLLKNRWTVTADGKGIERSFKFKTFAKTWVRRPRRPSRSQNLLKSRGTNIHDF